jgi:hypothetical protein
MPAHVAAISITGGAIDVSVLGDYAYVTSFGGHGVEILDISTPTSPASVGRINDNKDPAIAMRFARGIAVVGDYAYVASPGDDGVEILNISDPTNPTHVTAIFDTGPVPKALDRPIDITVVENYAYVVSADEGIEILDVSDPTAPKHVAAIYDDVPVATALYLANGITVVGDYAYVASAGDDGVEILDISGRYSTDSPYVTISTPQTFVTTIDSFTETPAVDNEGTVSYQVSPDNGTTWNYWNGTAWTTTTQTGGTETSPASDINANIATLDTDGGNFLWRAYLVSNGTQKLELDQIDSTESLYFSPPMRHGKRFLNEVLQPYIKEN